MFGQKLRPAVQLIAGAVFGITFVVCDGAGPPDTNAAPDGGMGDAGDMRIPGMGAGGGVPHYIDADTGDDLGAVLTFAGNDGPVVFSHKLNAPLSLATQKASPVYPFADCKGPLVFPVPDSLVGKRNSFGSTKLIAPIFFLGPDDTYLRMAGKATLADVTSHYELKFGSMVCVPGPRSYVDEYTDTKVAGKELYPNLRIELR